ncbi:hypothetical protein [Tropicimonas marinistellae]|nr:hypothetical protein [Tropicimonas marinistellae]
MRGTLFRAYWHIRGRIAQDGATRALKRHRWLVQRAEKFFLRRDRA